MTEEFKYNTEIIDKYNRLKKNYEKDSLEKTIIFEDNISDLEMKETLSNFNLLMKTKMKEMKNIKDKINQLTEYRDGILEIMRDMEAMEDKYVKLYQKTILNANDLKLEPPSYTNIQTMLTVAMQGGLLIESKHQPELIKKKLFTVNEVYKKNLCDVYSKIEDLINSQTMKMDKISDYIKVYKETVSTFELNKQILNKYTCTICYENEVKVCFLPCGHTFCRGCSERANRKCFVCNGTVTENKTIFLLGDTGSTDEEAVQEGLDPIAAEPEPARWNIFAR